MLTFSLWEDEPDKLGKSISLTSGYTESSPNKYTFYAFVGYYGYHFMAFINMESNWYLWEDTKKKLIGTFEEMQKEVEKRKVIPYLAFYQKNRKSAVSFQYFQLIDTH